MTDTTDQDLVQVPLELSDPHAHALAQLVKRFYFSDAEALAVDKAEAHLMIEAITKLQKALGEAGYSPR